MKKITKVCLLTVLVGMTSVTFITGCVEKVTLLPVEDLVTDILPGNFNYSMISSVDVDIYVNDKYDGAKNYYVEILNGDPFSDGGAKILTAGNTKGNTPYSITLAAPKGVTALYVRQTNPTGQQAVKAIDITYGTSFTCDFRPSSSSNATSLTTDEASISMMGSTEYLDANSYTLPSSYTTLTADGTTNLNGNNYVPSGVTVNDALGVPWKEYHLYVAGKVIIGSSFSTPAKSTIVVMDGGEVIFTAGADVGQKDNIIVVHKGGKFTVTGQLNLGQSTGTIINEGSVTLGSFLTNGDVYNHGTFIVGADYISQGDFINCVESATLNVTGTFQNNTKGLIENNGTITCNYLYGTNTTEILNQKTIKAVNAKFTTAVDITNNGNFIVDDTFTSTNSSDKLSNYGLLQAKIFDFSSCGIALSNYCHVKGQTIKAGNGSSLTGYSGSLIECENFVSEQSKVNLNSDAMFSIADMSDYTGTVDGLSGYRLDLSGRASGASIPLFIWGAIKSGCENTANSIGLKGTMYVVKGETVTYGSSYIQVQQSGVTMVSGADNLDYSIKSTSCNGGGFEGGEGGGGDDDYPKWIDLDSELTFLIEDMWPYQGDYDMNDVVFEITGIKEYINADNGVLKYKFTLTPKACGSSRLVSVALQLEKIGNSNVSYIKETSLSSSQTFVEVDAVHSKATLMLIPDFHKTVYNSSTHIMKNTIESEAKQSSRDFTYEITFNTPVAQTAVDPLSTNLNFFIIVGNNEIPRTEVHVAGYQPTDKVLRVDTNGYVDSETGQSWGLLLPFTGFYYPIEYTKITDAYPDFASWAASGGQSYSTWYNNPSSGKIYTK